MTFNARLSSIRPAHIFWTAIILLLAVSAIAAFSTYRLIEQYAASARTQQTLVELDRYLSNLKDVETRARGYALTLDERFLEPIDRDVSSVRRGLGRLQAMAPPESELAKRLDGLGEVTEHRILLARQLIDAASANADGIALSSSALAGQQTMDRIRGEMTAALAAQERDHARQTRRMEGQALIATATLAAGVALSLGMLAWLFRTLNREVSRRRSVEDELRTLNSELEQRVLARTTEVEQSRQLLDAVIENMPDTVFLKDVEDDFRYVMINEAGERLLGRSRDDLLGHVDHELFPTSEAKLCRKEDQRIVDRRTPRLVTERSLQTSTGERLIETRKVPLDLDDGGRKFVLGIARDLTEQKNLESQVRQMQRLESVGRLTGGVAHDFNNLLAVIMGSVELVREKLPADSEAATIADEALDASRRGAELVRRLLAFARRQHLDPVAVDLGDRLPDLVPLLQRTLGENVRVQVKPTDGLWHARIDPTQVDDALVNMAINARDAMPKGGKLTIETGNVILDEDYAAHHMEVEPGEYVMLAVSDTGSGMSPDVVARAFEPFFTTKSEGQGTGLGLSQVFGWVKQSGGHIKIYSELGHGTTIKLYLPRATEGDGKRQFAEAAEAHQPGHETILVVEDNPNVRRTAVRQLAGLGYSTIEAEDALTALEKIRSGIEFDLLLTDVVMPGGMNGYELAAQAEKLRPGTRVLFTSGYTELAVTELQAARAGPMISKPYTKRELARAVRSALGEGEQRRD